MPYTLKLSNGTVLTTVNDASLNISTSLTFVGRNYSGYGSIIDQNFVYLLQNFANSTMPTNSIQGQLWFNTGNQQLNVNYNGNVIGNAFKSLAYLNTSTTQPASLNNGDLWWNGSQLAICNGIDYTTIIGPPANAQSWVFDNSSYWDPVLYDLNTDVPGITPILTIASSITTSTTNNYNIPALFPSSGNLLDTFGNGGIVQGITLAGCDENGSSQLAGNYFWGTAAEALSAYVKTTPTSNNGSFYVPFFSDLSGNQSAYTTSTFYFNPANNVLHVTASAALYADLAERYEADTEYEIGTVVVIGGDKEITVTTVVGDMAVAGVISRNPAYMMNADAGNDQTHPYVALKGRVMCKVKGPVKKGQSLVTSTIPGYAQAYLGTENPRSIFAVSLQDFVGEQGLIEVKI